MRVRTAALSLRRRAAQEGAPGAPAQAAEAVGSDRMLGRQSARWSR
jgi:hypothetical protein